MRHPGGESPHIGKIRDALVPHQREITAPLWQVLGDDQRGAKFDEFATGWSDPLPGRSFTHCKSPPLHGAQFFDPTGKTAEMWNY